MLGQRLVRSAGKVNDARLLTLLADEARPCGLKRLPALAISESVAVPVTLGVFAPVIVLPAKSAEWDERKCRAVLAHELSHVARRDALTFMFSHFHRCLFWFSPLAWWLDRELRTLAEQASDDWALEQVQDGIYYAELLLGFSNDLDGAPMRVRWEGASMTKGIRVNERVERILRAPGTWPKRMRKPVAVALAIVAAPVIYFAASVRPAVAPQEPAPPAPAVAPVRPTAPAPAPAPVKPLVGIYREGPTPLPPAPPCEGVVAPAIAPPPMAAHGPIAPKLSPDGVPGAPAVAPIAPFMPTASISPCVGVVEPALAPVPPPAAAMPFPPQKPEAPVTKKPEPTNEFHGKGFSFGDDEEEGGEHYVIVEGDSISMSGSGDDAHRAKALRSKINGDYIWFHRDEKEYVITDQGTIKEAKALFAPQEELGRKQEALGKMQEELGARQEELGKHMEEIRVKLPDLRKEIKKLEAELSDIDTPKTQVELGELQAELGEMQAKIGEQMAQAGGMQGELGAKQGELGAQQGKLGREQGELGREQGRLAREANRKMKSLLDDAITRGIAKPASK